MSARHNKYRLLKKAKSTLGQIIILALCVSGQANAEAEKKSVNFSRGFMNFYNSGLDLSQFDGVDKIQPGDYKLEVFSNLRKLGTWPISFIPAKNKQGVNACMTPEMIIRFDVDTRKLPENWKTGRCLILETLVPGATVTYNQDDERLDVTVPQAMLLNTPEGYISPELWDDGEPTLMASYALSGSSTRNRELGETSNYLFGNLQTAMTLGAWRFVTYDTLNLGNDIDDEGVDHLQAFASRGIAALQSEVVLGDLNTSGEMFDTTAIRGARLATDDRMLPDSVRYYAPVVRGFANSNATVTIKQSGSTLYEKVVPPGEFAISDLYATGYNGDLEVTVKETDGTINTFTVPYSSVPQLLREGYFRYSLSSGEMRNTYLADAPWMTEGTLQYGLLNNLTGYVGAQTAFDGDYNALLGGVAINTPLGALGLDVTRSYTNFNTGMGSDDCGSLCDMSLRISLAKNLSETGTNFSLVGYRYSSKDYYSLADAVSVKQALEHGNDRYLPERYRERLEANINQMLPAGWGSFYVSGFIGNIWNDELGRTEKSNYALGYNNRFGTSTWGISLGRTNNEDGGHDDTIYLSVSMPLGHRYEKQARLGANFSYNSDEATIRTSLSGSAGERSQYGFSGYFSESSRPETNFGTNLSYVGDSASGGVAFSQSLHSFMGGLNMNGGVVVHRGGINLTPTLGDTIGVIEAKGAEGARVYPDSNAVIKDNGYGIVGYLTPYRYNDVFIDPKGTSMSVDVEDTRKSIVPTAGAAVHIKMETQQKQQTFVRFTHASGQKIPFGASISDGSDATLGMVGQGGLAMLTLPESGKPIVIKWKSNKVMNTCSAEVNHLSDNRKNRNMNKATSFDAIDIICKGL